MATSKVLQTPSIIGIIGSTIRIKHPDISKYTRTYLRSPIASTGTAMSVFDNNTFADDDWFIVGELNDGKTEENDVNGTVTRGSAITVTNTLKFDHEINDPVTKIYERGIKIYGAASDGGAGTLITSVDAITTPIADAVSIQWSKPYTEYTLISTDTAYDYYFVKFTDGTTDSSSSDYIASSGVVYNAASSFIDSALRLTNSEIDNLITWEYLIECVQDCQDEIAQFAYNDRTTGNIMKKDWSFEVVENDTSLAASIFEDRYALSGLTNALKYTNSKQAILNVRFNGDTLNWLPVQEFDMIREDTVRSELNAAYTAGATTMTLKDSTMFTETGSGQIGSETFTYTANAQSTGILSGIPASGTGSLASSYSANRAVWQGATSGLPTRYTIFNGNIYLDVPPSSTYENYKIKIRYLRAMTRITQSSDTTIVTFTNAFQWYLAARIEYRRGRNEKAKEYMARFQELLLMNAKGEKSPILESYQYYTWSDGELINDSPTGFASFNSGNFDS